VNLYHWSRLELRHVVALRTVIEAGSFWAAADRLDTSQSALRQQIAALEHVVGARLIERSRGRRSIAVTEAGEIFLRHADAIVARLRAAHSDFTALARARPARYASARSRAPGRESSLCSCGPSAGPGPK
jgi:DNA-binding transcriptional LysR family regulator